jgi:hypothetical protein
MIEEVILSKLTGTPLSDDQQRLFDIMEYYFPVLIDNDSYLCISGKITYYIKDGEMLLTNDIIKDFIFHNVPDRDLVVEYFRVRFKYEIVHIYYCNFNDETGKYSNVKHINTSREKICVDISFYSKFYDKKNKIVYNINTDLYKNNCYIYCTIIVVDDKKMVDISSLDYFDTMDDILDKPMGSVCNKYLVLNICNKITKCLYESKFVPNKYLNMKKEFDDLKFRDDHLRYLFENYDIVKREEPRRYEDMCGEVPDRKIYNIDGIDVYALSYKDATNIIKTRK